MAEMMTVTGARLHNLKRVSLSVPRNSLVVFTGISGSGKSTLVLDTIHKEGQRQYMESLGLVTDGLTRPPMDSIQGLSPSISVDQRITNHSPRSTVGTATEVFTYLRVLFARLGTRTCMSCGADVPPSQDMSSSDPMDDDDGNGGEPGDSRPCPRCGAPVPEIGMANFSFNKPAGACPTCTGLGVVSEPRLDLLVDESLSIAGGAVRAWEKFYITHYSKVLQAAGRYYGFVFDVKASVKGLGEAQRDLLFYGVASPRFIRHFPDIRPARTNAEGRFEGVSTNLLRRYGERAGDAEYRQKMEKLLHQRTCPDCGGTRLKVESRNVKVNGRNIVEISRLPLTSLAEWLSTVGARLGPEHVSIAEPIISDLDGRVRRLIDVGAGYLTLERSYPTLSAGEAQRLRLAALLGSGLTGVQYVLDEPTIGLHPRDTGRLISVMRKLRDLGNTVLVIEHDMDVLRAADHVVDVGPGAGREGGKIVAEGTPEAVARSAGSITGDYLGGRAAVPVPEARRKGNGKLLVIRGARENNLDNITVGLPLGMLIAVTGVSGSGKSSLMLDILDRAGRMRFYGAGDEPGAHDAIDGWENLDKIVTIDQQAIGRTPRSNAATYSDAFTPIREAYARQPEAVARKLAARHFSFNVPGGRCERCEGAGVLTVEMHFLPDVQVRCPACHGRRFMKDVLAVSFDGYDISRLLDSSIEEALSVFRDVPAVASRLSLMTDVGLGYLQLGQPATTLSGGEAQRVKLARELGKRGTGRTLYLLDEPTTGLHVADTVRLLGVLQRLVDAGNTVIAIEHNLDVIKTADWVIDLGPEGGSAGGRLVAEGTPEDVARVRGSVTGKYLERVLRPS